jgi:hypothetical protein
MISAVGALRGNYVGGKITKASKRKWNPSSILTGSFINSFYQQLLQTPTTSQALNYVLERLANTLHLPSRTSRSSVGLNVLKGELSFT